MHELRQYQRVFVNVDLLMWGGHSCPPGFAFVGRAPSPAAFDLAVSMYALQDCRTHRECGTDRIRQSHPRAQTPVEGIRQGRWKKLKGTADVEFFDGTIRHAEIHWYEAHGIGPKEYKIKRILD
jgi:hypothetical protein